SVVFGFFAHDEGVEAEPAQYTTVHDGGGDGVGAHGESADGLRLWDVGDEVEHDVADEGGDAVVEAHFAEVDVVAGFGAAREGEVTVEDRIASDVVDKVLPGIRHPINSTDGAATRPYAVWRRCALLVRRRAGAG